MASNYSKKDFDKILKRYVAGTANAEEIKFIEAYYESLAQTENVLHKWSNEEQSYLEVQSLKVIKENIAKSNKSAIPIYYYLSAAIILISLSIAILYTQPEKIASNDPYKITAKKIDVLPGTDQAILTLADGSKVVLDNNSNENIVETAGLTISKTKDGEVIYKVNSDKSSSKSNAYNTIETAKGNQYKIFLPDGTKVWLNASSSLKYPEIFAGNERKVSLTGEAYFEVAKNRAAPFIVSTTIAGSNHAQEVEVLGTHFNINSYLDEHVIKTTLLEGSIKLSNGNFSKILKPGQQALVKSGLHDISIVKDIDTEDEVAWKNGLFRFSNADLKSILNQLERWYDIKIDYKSIPEKRYNGMVPRAAKLSEVLQMLELTGNISFKIEENRKLKVLNK